MGNAIGGVVFTNTTRRTCSLSGRPHVELRPSYGVRQIEVVGTEPPPLPQGRRVVLGPGASAVLGLSWTNWCLRKLPSVLQIHLPGDKGTLDLPNPGAPTCLSPGGPTVIGVQTFARTPS